jgi:hypothetical protein
VDSYVDTRNIGTILEIRFLRAITAEQAIETQMARCTRHCRCDFRVGGLREQSFVIENFGAR